MLKSAYRNVTRILTLPCEEHRRLQATRLDGRIGWVDRLAMSGHWLVCRPCRRVVRQLRRIDAAARSLGDRVKSDRMPPEIRQRLSQQIEASRDGH